MNISAAIDFSTAEAALAIGKANSDELIFSAARTMSGRDASVLLPWIILQIEKHGYSLDDITQWTCGTGPGSFTGLRIIASLVAGLTYGKMNIEVRGVPSATAIAEKCSEKGQKTIVLFDGRRNELICFSTKNEPLLTVSSDNVNHLSIFDNICAMDSGRKALENILPEEMLKKVKYLSIFPIENLLFNKSTPWHKNQEGDSFFEPDLVYIRPAV